jgi:hypothetical protein
VDQIAADCNPWITQQEFPKRKFHFLNIVSTEEEILSWLFFCVLNTIFASISLKNPKTFLDYEESWLYFGFCCIDPACSGSKNRA